MIALEAIGRVFLDYNKDMIDLIKDYLNKNGYNNFDLKSVLFDMDGVLYNSMPAHAQSWQETMVEFGFETTSSEEFFLHEGRVAEATVNMLFERERNRTANEEEQEQIYARKTELFQKYNTGATIEKSHSVIELVKDRGLLPVLVTGSGQAALLDKLNDNFPKTFTPDTMVTAFDVQIGKPHPEPFLMGLQKGGNLKPNQAIAIENAPLGTEAAHKAGVFTIAVNTGPLDAQVLWDSGANMVFGSMGELYDNLPNILDLMAEVQV